MQFFKPHEYLQDKVLIRLIFLQIVQDIYSDSCIRIAKFRKEEMKKQLG